MSNIQFVFLESTPDLVPIASVYDAEILGTTEGKTIQIEEGGSAIGVDAGTNIVLQEVSSNDVTVQRDGTTLKIFDAQGDIILQVAASISSTSIVEFSNGEAEVTVEINDGKAFVGFGDVLLEVGDTADGSDLGIGEEEVNLDTLGGSNAIASQVVLQDVAYILTDDVSVTSNTDISGFGADDLLQLSGVTESDVSIQESGGNTQIEFDDGLGTVSQIELLGVTYSAGFVDSIAAFNANPDYGDIVIA